MNDKSDISTTTKHTEPQQMAANQFNLCMEWASITERLDSLAGCRSCVLKMFCFLHTFE